MIADKPSKVVAVSQKQEKYLAITGTAAADHFTKGWEGKALYLAGRIQGAQWLCIAMEKLSDRS